MPSTAPFPAKPWLSVRGAIGLLSLLLLFALSLPAAAKAPQSAERPMPRPLAVVEQSGDAILARKIARAQPPGASAAILIDVDTGQTLAAYNANTPMPPASVTKVVTTLYANAHLGRGHQFTTRLLATGPIAGGRLQGDLILSGGGDPELDTDELAELVKALERNGIREISGRFLFDDSRLPRVRAIAKGQPPNAAYNPGLSGLNLNFNRVFFEWEPAGSHVSLRLEARDEGHSPAVSTSSVVAVDRAGPVYRYSEQGGADHWSIAIGALKKPGGVWLPVRDPGAYAADAFAKIARARGISLPRAARATAGELVPGATVLGTIARRPLAEVCRGMLHFSTNVTAELVGLAASQDRAPVRGLSASASRMSGWVASTYGTASQHFEDHSGLSAANRVSAADMARIIATARADGSLEGLLRRHFVARPGSNKPANAQTEVRAKTGTLNFVRALAGTIEGAGGRRLAFAIFSADAAARARADHTRANPPGARRFNRRAVNMEQVILADWIARFAS